MAKLSVATSAYFFALVPELERNDDDPFRDCFLTSTKYIVATGCSILPPKIKSSHSVVSLLSPQTQPSVPVSFSTILYNGNNTSMYYTVSPIRKKRSPCLLYCFVLTIERLLQETQRNKKTKRLDSKGCLHEV